MTINAQEPTAWHAKARSWEPYLSAVLVLCAAITVSIALVRRQSGVVVEAPQKVENWEELVSASSRIGSTAAPIRLVVFSDFECPFCRLANAVLQPPGSRAGESWALGYLEFPLTATHPHAFDAAVAAECAGRQGKFEAYHHALFREQSLLRSAAWDSLAVLTGIPRRRAFTRCWREQLTSERIHGHLELGRRLRVSGTPMFIADGVFLGALSSERLVRLIDSMSANRYP